MLNVANLSLTAVILPLIASLTAGLLGKQIGRVGAHTVTILAVALSLLCAGLIWSQQPTTVSFTVYHWAIVQGLQFNVGFLIDPLSSIMLVVVCFVSLLVHVYSMGYMAHDPGYQRFFSYISLFTFAMLMLVLANNFMQLFFGWEAVGLVSYLLIGFWYTRDSATLGSFKAFMVNRVGDFGFLLGIALVLTTFGSLDYDAVFANAALATQNDVPWWPGLSQITAICLLLFVGAMGKSAQVPLHVWLPESMEGPTPISALIHAATMVTAGIYMVARMSPLYELSDSALNAILAIGATGALFLGLLGLVQHDIKRVVAYSTLSQLGYMVAGLGASAYAISMFHLVTHACFKALLFLGAGSVIIAMHHEQDLRKMGGLHRFMPITYWTSLLGSCALAGLPPFAGFYSKDLLITAVAASHLPATRYASWCLTLGVFVTALYTFRAFLLTFHTTPRMDAHARQGLQESPFAVWFPLVLLAIPSVLLGGLMVNGVLDSLFANTLYVDSAHHHAMQHLQSHHYGTFSLLLHAPFTAAFWLAALGIATAYLAYELLPALPAQLASWSGPLYRLLHAKYGFDILNQMVFVRGVRGLGCGLYRLADRRLIDGLVNMSASVTACTAALVRKTQTGLLYHYTLAMVLGLAGLIWLLQGAF